MTRIPNGPTPQSGRQFGYQVVRKDRKHDSSVELNETHLSLVFSVHNHHVRRVGFRYYSLKLILIQT